ncbi:unnamed protein product, partial [Mesorhabditis spiculigera]
MFLNFGVFLLAILANRNAAAIDCAGSGCDDLTCQDGWTAMNRTRSCFKLIRNVSMSNSSAECRRYGATVASIRNANENKDLLEFAIHDQVKQKEAFFLGANMTGKGPWEFKWIDGKPVNYTNWARKEPNDHRDQGETCIEMYVRYWKFDKMKSLEQNMEATGAGKWNDLNTLSTTATTTKRVPKPTCGDATWKLREKTSKCYAILNEATDFDKALLRCEAMNGTLASVHSEDENNYIRDETTWVLNETNLFWLGARRNSGTVGDFSWLDDSPMNYTKWSKDLDNLDGRESCLELRVTREWNDRPCDTKNRGICQKAPIWV